MKILVPFAPSTSTPTSVLVTLIGPSSHHWLNNRGGQNHNQSQQSWTLPTTQLWLYRPAPPPLSPRHPTLLPQLGHSRYLEHCQICGITGHTAQQFSSLSTSILASLPSTLAQAPRLTFTTPYAQTIVHHPNPSHSLDWVIDSGTSHHVTSDLAALALHEPYIASYNVIIGTDGTSLSIAHIGSFTLPSLPTLLLFTNVLHVHAMSKNLISVSALYVDPY